MRRAVCPGSYDPITNGHLDVIERASGLFDEVIVAVGINKNKRTLFTVEQRLAMIAQVTEEFGNVRADSYEGLLVDYCRAEQAPAIVKGIRAAGDFDYELQMAQMNHGLTGVETLFLPTSPRYSFLSSSLVKEVAAHGGTVDGLLPATVHERLLERLAQD
ncbi:pantetheine-phosphate adenylyltransferase [Sciscionella sediminilitoris]|uniref:pantetheine-phosphate adenylyltransferase n=1 Tax=Sciscionella sediminilitoris TaxID=1445613 RepID=UPI0004DFA488|nr:pantetheine-phosphate adenylyltransferase [Sciscionella sp. SE31]